VTARYDPELPRLDANTPSSARIYDYLLGGSYNFAVDREAAQGMIAAFPALPQVLRAGRAFVRRATRYLAAEQGVTQYLDLGSGIPTVRNVHEIAQAAQGKESTRVAYVDIDPVAVAHARRILHGNPAVTCVQADLRNPAAVCANPDIRAVIDFSRPVAVMLNAVLHFIPDDDEANSIVGAYLGAVPAGSYLVLGHHTSDSVDAAEAEARQIYARTTQALVPRSRAKITAFFAGTELVEPGVVLTPNWRPDPAEMSEQPTGDTPLYFGYAGVGRK
jgi:SAM-dependent methyltransferase